MIKTIAFLMFLNVSLWAASPAHAGEFLEGEAAEQKLAEEYSIHFEGFSSLVGCYKKMRKDVQSGGHPICWSNDQRKISAMSISVFAVDSGVSAKTLKKKALKMTFQSSDYKLTLLGRKELPSDMTVTHYRVSWPDGSYKPYISVVQFSTKGKNIFVVFFNGNARKTKNTPTPILKDVMKFLEEGKLYPIR